MKTLIASLIVLAMPAFAANAAPNTADLTWTAPATYSDGAAVDPSTLTYGVYQGTGAGSTKAKVATTPKGAVTFSISGLSLPSGSTQCWQVSAISADGKEGGLSNEACKTFPAAVPGAPVGLGAK